MSRAAVAAVWIATLLSISGIIHAYFWWRIVRAPGLPHPWRLPVTIALIVLALSIPGPFLASRFFVSPWREIVTWMMFVWMGLMFFLFVGFLAADVVKLLVWGIGKIAPVTGLLPDPERRVFISRLLAGGVGLSTVGVGLFAHYSANKGPIIRNVTVTLRRLPKKLSGMTIVQISDLHVGEIIGRDYVENIVRRTNELKPDIIAITGDLVDGSASRHGESVAPLGELKAKHGVFFVTGNHEYYSGVDHWLPFIEKLGIRILRNERLTIGDDEASFDLAGVDDSSAHRIAEGHGADVERALEGRDPNREVVLLAHQPKEIFRAAKHDVGLQLSGHTHGGQLWPFKYIVALAQPYVDGLHQHETTQIYVSSGTGYWGPPMRFGVRSELTRIKLLSAANV